MEKLEEKDKVFEKYNFPKLNQEEVENLNRHITAQKFKLQSDIVQRKKAQVWTASQLNSTKNFEKS